MKSNKKIAIYPAEPISLLLNIAPTKAEMTFHEPGDKPLSLSKLMNTYCDRYLAILQENFPVMEKGVWELILDSTNGRRFFSLKEIMNKEVIRLIYASHSNEDDEVDPETLNVLNSLSDLSVSAHMGIVMVVEAFWGQSRLSKERQSLEDILSVISGRPRFALFSEHSFSAEDWEIASVKQGVVHNNEKELFFKLKMEPEITAKVSVRDAMFSLEIANIPDTLWWSLKEYELKQALSQAVTSFVGCH